MELSESVKLNFVGLIHQMEAISDSYKDFVTTGDYVIKAFGGYYAVSGSQNFQDR